MPEKLPTPAGGRSLFREEALRHHLLRREFGDVLRLPPSWTRWAYPLVVSAAAAAAVFLATAQAPRYAVGPATLGPGGRTASAWLAADQSRGLTAGAWASVVLDGVARGRVQGRVLAIASAPEVREGRAVLGVQLALDPPRDGSVPLLDGMSGVAEVRVGRERWIALLSPGIGRRSG